MKQPLGPHGRELHEQVKDALDRVNTEVAADVFREIAVAMTKAADAAETHDYRGVTAVVQSVFEYLEGMVLSTYLAMEMVAEARQKDIEGN
jgi:mevalonate kinase